MIMWIWDSRRTNFFYFLLRTAVFPSRAFLDLLKETLGSGFINNSSKISLAVPANREFSKHVMLTWTSQKPHGKHQNLCLGDKTEQNSPKKKQLRVDNKETWLSLKGIGKLGGENVKWVWTPNPTNDIVIGWRGEEKLTDGCDDGPGEEEGGAGVPQAGLIEGVSWRVHAGSDSGNHLLQRGGRTGWAGATDYQGPSSGVQQQGGGKLKVSTYDSYAPWSGLWVQFSESTYHNSGSAKTLFDLYQPLTRFWDC